MAATAQQGAVAPVSQSDGRAAAETVVEGSEYLHMSNAGVEALATAAGGAAEDEPGAVVDAGTAVGVRPPNPSN